MINSKKMMFAAVIGTGVILSSKAQADQMTQWLFEHLDANSDGQITKSEFRGSYLDGEGQDWTIGLRPACTEAVMKAMDPEMAKTFKAMDTSNDGKISKGEFMTSGLKMYNEYWEKTFQLADKNKDRKLSETEFVKQLDDHYANLKKEYAQNKIPADCQTDLNELYASHEEIATAKQYFKMLDANSNGSLTRDEYMGAGKG